MFNTLIAKLKSNKQSLPPRVEQQITEYQRKSEQLIGWVQLFAIIAFAVVYAIAPKTFTEEAPFEPIPWTLSAYAIFTLLRLYISYKSELPKWFICLSVLVDMLVLMITIWSFHIQYAQPAGFYFKVPTLLYVFIFIALRALRFETVWIAVSGIFAAIGWLCLILYALYLDPYQNEITNDFVMYITSSKMLIGAEIDKILVILTVTFIMAFAMYRARRVLITATTQNVATQDFSKFFDPKVAERIKSFKDTLQPGEGVEREAAILFVDLRGFSKASHTLTPDELVMLISEYQEICVPVIQKHNGNIDKFMGDGILASFGAVADSKKYAYDGLSAISELIDASKKWMAKRKSENKSVLKIGMALASGPVVFGIIGDNTRLEYTVIGDTVNLAAKLEKHTKTEKVQALCNIEAYEKALKQGLKNKPYFKKRPQREVEGISEKVDLVSIEK